LRSCRLLTPLLTTPIFRRYRDHHVYAIGLKILFLNAALLQLGQPSEHLAQVSALLGLGELFAQHPADFRGKNAQLGVADLLRQSVYSRLAG
jgi:hypothetical protein